MLKVRVVAVGKNKEAWVADGVAHYSKMLKKYVQLDLVELPGLKKTDTLSAAEQRRLEASLFLKQMPISGTVISLVPDGRAMDSLQFSHFLGKLEESAKGTASFLVGGPYGLHDDVLKLSHFRVSLSSMTFSHQLVRLVLLEQLYRGFNLLRGGDYHK